MGIDGYCPVRALANIPEAIRHPRGLSLVGSWFGTYGPHLTFWRQRIFQQTAMAVPSPSKEALREDALILRRGYASALWPSTRASLEAQLAKLVLPHLSGARAIAVYHPLKDEISPYPIVDALDGGARIGFPWFADRNSIFIWREGPTSEPGPWGVLQPAPDSPPIVPDIVLVPLVLADRSGTRIGHGKGHYDRALAHLRESGSPVFTIGLGWEVQIEDGPLPSESWDIPLDAIATPKEWIDCS